MSQEIQLYSLATPNGMKVGVALEEMEIPYVPHTINILKNDQFTDDFKKINPNSKIPAIVDPNGPHGEPFALFESGAILMYLAEKSGKFLSTDPAERWETIQWVFFQMGVLSNGWSGSHVWTVWPFLQIRQGQMQGPLSQRAILQ